MSHFSRLPLSDLPLVQIAAYSDGKLKMLKRGRASSYVDALRQCDDGQDGASFDKVVIEFVKEQSEATLEDIRKADLDYGLHQSKIPGSNVRLSSLRPMET